MKNNTAIILLLLSVGLFYTFTNNQYQDVKKLYALAGEYKNILQNIAVIVELRDSLRVTYNTLPITEIARVNKILPDNINTVRLALDLDSMASRHGISIDSVKVEVGAPKEADLVVLPEYAEIYEKAVVSLKFVSNYKNFMLLLADIEKSLRIMDVRSVSFETTDSGFYEYELSVDAYWLK